MSKVDDIFSGAEGGVLTLEQFLKISEQKGAKFVDLSEGNYISVKKHNDELESKDSQINSLNATINDRDKDLKAVQKQLEDAGVDAEKLGNVTKDLEALQTKYKEDTEKYEKQLSKQARDFAIKEHAATKKFSSAAAKRDYINSMTLSENVKLDKSGSLKGLTDFDDDYSKENPDALITEPETPPDGGIGSEGTGANNNTPPGNPLPMFVDSTGGEPFKGDGANESFGFSFMPKE